MNSWKKLKQKSIEISDNQKIPKLPNKAAP